MNHSSFLIRPAPLIGESLSSYRQRVAWANGFRVFPVLDERRRRVDHDRRLPDLEAVWVSETHRRSVAELQALTLQPYLGRVTGAESTSRTPPWWLCMRYGAGQPTFGPMVCPRCLAEDSVAHFRLIWRFAFVTRCPVHQCRLQDRCFSCGLAPWPTGGATREHVSREFWTFGKCWHCGAEMATAPVTSAVTVEHANSWHDWLDRDSVVLGRHAVAASAAFTGLREICQLFIRTTSARLIAQGGDVYAETADTLLRLDEKAHCIEQQPIAIRALLVPVAREIMSDWPNGFLKFADACQITRQHFFGSYQRLPWMMRKIVDTRLAKQNRFVTVQHVKKQFDAHLAKHGVAPIRADLRRHFGSGCKKAFSSLYVARWQASEDEAIALLKRYFALRTMAFKHAQRRNPFVFNSAVLAARLVDVIERRETAISPTALLTKLRAGVPFDDCHWQHLFVQQAIDDLRLSCATSPLWACEHKGNRREIRDHLNHLMAYLPVELVRDIQVFRKCDAKFVAAAL